MRLTPESVDIGKMIVLPHESRLHLDPGAPLPEKELTSLGQKGLPQQEPSVVGCNSSSLSAVPSLPATLQGVLLPSSIVYADNSLK